RCQHQHGAWQLAHYRIANYSKSVLSQPSMSESTVTTAPAASVQTDFEAEERGEARRIGRAIKVLRLRSGLSREAAADRLGTTVEAWAKYERGEVVGIFRPSVQARVVE